MGKVVPKKHMAFVYEESKQANTDCILQSFLGRMCGHDSYPDVPTQIFVPEGFLKVNKRFGVSEMERYIRFTDGEIIMPTKASCLGPLPMTGGQYTLQVRWVPFTALEEAADAEDPEDALSCVKAACARDRKLKDGTFVIKKRSLLSDDEREAYIRLAMTFLAENQYPDTVQHTAALAILGGAESTKHVEFPIHSTYSDKHRHDLAAAAAAGERFGTFKDSRKPESIEDDDDEDSTASTASEPSSVVKYFKFYRCVDGFYISGFTDEASPETDRDIKAHIVKTTGKEVWNPATDSLVPTQVLSIVHTADNLIEQIGLLPPTAQRTLFIHKSLAANAEVSTLVAQIARKSATGKGGKNWPKRETANRKDYERFVLPAGLIIRIDTTTTTTIVTKIVVRVIEDGVSTELDTNTVTTESKTKHAESIRVPCGGAGAASD
jgi:hypothetical protein